jgi:hypothetical protein
MLGRERGFDRDGVDLDHQVNGIASERERMVRQMLGRLCAS